MFVDFMIRRRAVLHEVIPEFNAKIVQRFAAISKFWGNDKTSVDAPIDYNGEGAALDLRKALQPGLSGQASYVPRFEGYLSSDVARSDDFLAIRLNTNKADYPNFCSTTLPLLIEIFGAYRAAVETDNAVALADFEITRMQSQTTGRNIDGRDSVHRIWPVCFFDDLLCRRAFGVGAAEVVARAAPACVRAELLCGGAFLLVTTELVVGQPALDALNARVMARLDTRAPTQAGAA